MYPKQKFLSAVSFSDDPASRENFGPFVPGIELVPYNDIDALNAQLKMIDDEKMRIFSGSPKLSEINMRQLNESFEILKGQILYSFVHVFHSIVIYSTDMLYICNRKYLIVNILLFFSFITSLITIIYYYYYLRASVLLFFIYYCY